jgi:hypothetical protein
MKKIKFTQSVGFYLVINVIFYYLVTSCWFLDEENNIYNSTELHIANKSDIDSVKVFLTLQSPYSVIGHFGIKPSDTIGSVSQGYFWALKDSIYSTKNNGNPFIGFVITFDTTNISCESAKGTKFNTGVNVFEGTLNVEYESFDISCVDGVNSVMKVSVDYGSGWQTGVGSYVKEFESCENDKDLANNYNIRGVFPYMCTTCTGKYNEPKNCFELPIKCSEQETCQTSRKSLKGGDIVLHYINSTIK